jgi:RNA polymerase sigma-70 factor (ECF subfamily)
MDDSDFLAGEFEDNRAHLRAVAYRMLGSLSDADDAVQEAWLRLSRSDAGQIENLRAWLTTVVARVSLTMLQSRKRRGEQGFGEMPEPIVSSSEGTDPEHESLLADSVGLALLVVLESLSPAERLAFVLHDMFAVPFDEIALIVDRSEPATRKLASRARNRVQGQAPVPDPDRARQREVVDAFLTASRGGDFDALVAVLDPDVVLRADGGGPRGAPQEVRGAEAVAGQAQRFSSLAPFSRPALVNGAAGVVTVRNGRTVSVMGFTVTDGKVVELDIISDPERLAHLDLA